MVLRCPSHLYLSWGWQYRSYCLWTIAARHFMPLKWGLVPPKEVYDAIRVVRHGGLYGSVGSMACLADSFTWNRVVPSLGTCGLVDVFAVRCRLIKPDFCWICGALPSLGRFRWCDSWISLLIQLLLYRSTSLVDLILLLLHSQLRRTIHSSLA